MWFLVLVLLPGFGFAETIVSVVSENDTYGGGTDEHYTNGARLSVLLTDADAPDFALRLADFLPLKGERRTGVSYSLGHNLYTPEDITLAVPDSTDRPYAALVYGSIGMVSMPYDVSTVDEVELMVGWVGPGAMGREVQQIVHEALDVRKPRGWESQLRDEPIANVFWQRRWPRWRNQVLGPVRLSLTPHIGGALGNAYVHGHGGGTVTLQPKDATLQDHPLRVRPSMPGTGYYDAPRERLSWQVFAGADARVVGRNIFLDGNTFRDSPSVERQIVTGDVQAGVAFTYQNWRVGYTVVYRAEEFENQDDGNLFGAVSLSFRY